MTSFRTHLLAIVSALTVLIAGSTTASPRPRLLTGDSPESPALRRTLVPEASLSNPFHANLPGRDDADSLFTYRFMVSDDGAENWSEIFGVGDLGMWERDQNGDPVQAFPEAAYNFGAVVSEDNDLHFIAVLNAYSEEDDLNPEGRVNGLYDIRVDADGETNLTLIDRQSAGGTMNWADGGIDAEGNLYALWVSVAEDRASILASRSEDNGDEWSDPRVLLQDLDVADGLTDLPFPHMTYHVGEFFFVIYQTPDDNGAWVHRILRVPASLEGNVAQQNPGCSSATFVSYYVTAVDPIDQDVEAGFVYFAVRNADNSGTTIGRTDNNGQNWRLEVVQGAQRYPSIALDRENETPWVFSNFAVDNPHRNWYSFDEGGYGGGDWINQRALDEVNFDGTRELLYIHQGAFTSEGRLVSGCHIWGQFTPEGFQTNFSDAPYDHDWAGPQRLYSIFDEEEPLAGGFIPQNILLTGADNHVFVAFAGKYGGSDFAGPVIDQVSLSSFRLDEPWVVQARIEDENGVFYNDISYWIAGQQEAAFSEGEPVDVDGNGNGTYRYTIPSWDINGEAAQEGETVFFFIFAMDALNNAAQSENFFIVADVEWSGGEPPEPTPPVFTEVPDTFAINEGERLMLYVQAEDEDGDDMEVSIIEETKPDSASFFDRGDGRGLLTWRTGFNDAGEWDPVFVVSDGELTDTAVVHLIVRNVDQARPPAFTEVPEGVEADETDEVRFSLMATDEDGDTLEITALEESLPEGSEFNDNGNGTGEFVWQTDYEDAGEYNPVFVVSDGELTDTAVVRIIVNNVNRAPSASHLDSPVDNFSWTPVINPSLPFVWRSVSDPDNEPIHYKVEMYGWRNETGRFGTIFFDAGSDTGIAIDYDSVENLFYEGEEVRWCVWAYDEEDSTQSEERFTIYYASSASDPRLSAFSFKLLQPYPSPFNSSTTISFSLPVGTTDFSLSIYDLSGRLVQELMNGLYAAGEHKVVWEAGDLRSGVYVVRLEGAGKAVSRKIVLMR